MIGEKIKHEKCIKLAKITFTYLEIKLKQQLFHLYRAERREI